MHCWGGAARKRKSPKRQTGKARSNSGPRPAPRSIRRRPGRKRPCRALDFTILARKTIQKTITASLTNSVISLECGEWFKKYYSEAQFTVQTEAGNNFSFTHSSSPDTPIFVKPGSKLLLKGTAVKAQNGVKVEFPQQQIGVTTARTWHKIRIDASQAGQGSISIRLDDTLTEVPPQEIELNPEA